VPARVTLLASAFDSARFLPAWLESLEAQTIWPDCELIVVANDPAPAERERLDDFAARHPQVVVKTVPREPLYRSWNRAIAAAEAPLLAIANVDDIRTPDGLERQVALLEERPELSLAYGGFEITREFPPGAPVQVIRPEPFEREHFTRGMMLGPFFVWRPSGDPATRFFDEQLRVAADMDLAVRLALHGEGAPVDGSLGFYYDGGTGLSTGGDAQKIEGVVLILRYGIYDKLDVRYVPQAAEYVIPQLLMPGGEWLPVADVVPDYAAFLAGRRERWFAPPRTMRQRVRETLR
jgi:hypothetical protein